MKRLRVLMTRQEIVPDRLAGAAAVVVDVFLATTLLTMLEFVADVGASDLVPEVGAGQLTRGGRLQEIYL